MPAPPLEPGVTKAPGAATIPMRILFWSELYWPYIGGAEVFGATLLRDLRARGHELAVVTSHDHLDLPDTDELEGVPVSRFPFRAAFRRGAARDFAASLAGAARLKREFRPDLVHVNALGPSLVFHLRTLGAHPCPWLVTLQQEILESGASPGETLAGQALRAADWVTAVSGKVLGQARALVPELSDRSSVLYNTVALPTLAPAPLPAATLLCLGRLVPAKGFDLALEAFAALRARLPEARLIVAGDGPLRADLEALARSLGVRDATDFRGWVPPERVAETLNEATTVLMPSLREGLPVAAVQAAMMGRPVVASPAGGMPEIVLDGRTGLLLESRDPSAWAAAVESLLRDRETVEALGAAARRHALSAFDWYATVTGYEALYSDLLRRCSARC